MAPDETAQLLSDLAGYVRRFVVVSADQQIVVALWILHTHAIAAADQTPYLNPRSAEKQSGKTRLLEVLELLCARAKLFIRPSEAVTFRLIRQQQPTLLLDEIDTIWSDRGYEHEGLRALLDAGNRRGVTVPRVAGPTFQLEEFPVFCAKAFAGIGLPPDTIADRSIPIVLKRRTRDEHIERFRRRGRAVTEDAPVLHARAVEWASRYVPELADAEPDLPEELSDRAQDVVEPLLAIADLAGGDWVTRAREALVDVITGATTGADTSLRLRLLADTRRAFADLGQPDRVQSATLVDTLIAMDDAPWRDLHDKQLSQAKLAWLLRPYEIAPKKIRFDQTVVVKGYERAAFVEAWSRYLLTEELEQTPDVPVLEFA